MLRYDFIKRKIDLIIDDLLKLSSYKKYSLNEIASDFQIFSVVERLLEKIIMRAIDINEHIIAELSQGNEKRPSYKETFLLLAALKIYTASFAEKISASAGLRNALIHDYDDVKIEDVYYSINDALKQYKKYCDYILKFIDKK